MRSGETFNIIMFNHKSILISCMIIIFSLPAVYPFHPLAAAFNEGYQIATCTGNCCLALVELSDTCDANDNCSGGPDTVFLTVYTDTSFGGDQFTIHYDPEYCPLENSRNPNCVGVDGTEIINSAQFDTNGFACNIVSFTKDTEAGIQLLSDVESFFNGEVSYLVSTNQDTHILCIDCWGWDSERNAQPASYSRCCQSVCDSVRVRTLLGLV
jgi:hypothetical protein